jgi:uncharacterized protein YecE (DUF72 family)
VDGWRRGGADVYVYFDNDAKVHAPTDALRLIEELGRREATLRPRRATTNVGRSTAWRGDRTKGRAAHG